MASDHITSFTRELEFRARLFRKPLDAAALAKLHPPAGEVFRAARLAGASQDSVREYIATVASRTVRLKGSADGGVQGTTIKLLTEDGVLHLADAEWSDSWKVRALIFDELILYIVTCRIICHMQQRGHPHTVCSRECPAVRRS